jgi:uncharacterized protein YrrD
MMDNDAPISWMTLEKGTPVVSSDGDEVGKIDEVVADRQKDIFSGVTISSGLLSTSRFAPAAVIADMSPDGVRLSLTSAEAEELEGYGT